MKLEIKSELISKYDIAGPRYTSYPPVPHFTSDVNETDYKEYLRSSQLTDQVSLYFHFPFCKSLCYYCGCNVVITSNQDIIENYLSNLKEEIRLVIENIKKDIVVKQLHWGGGTPNYLNLHQMEDIFNFIRNEFNINATAEVSIELDPRTVSFEQLYILKELGFNRISFGVQDLNEQTQKSINRIQPVDMIEQIYYKAREVGFSSINLDFIYGLPYQTVNNYNFNLKKILEWKPDRLAFFSYAHVPWIKKHQKLIERHYLPLNFEKILIFKNIVETLTDNGYVYIGLDHFAKPEDELSKALQEKKLHRNFQGYTVLKDMDVIAFGITAISQFKQLYIRNLKDLKTYKESVQSSRLPVIDGYKMSEDDILRRTIINQIMCNLHIDIKSIEREFNINFINYFHQELKKLKELEEELIKLSDKEISVLSPGRPLIRNIAMIFDSFLNQKKENRPLYSRTI